MLLFGTAGIPTTVKGKGLAEGIREVKRLGLDCMEVEFVRGVRLKEKDARAAGKVAAEEGVALTAHGPYYINLCSKEPDKVRASVEHIIQTGLRCHQLGGKSITFHAAFYQGRDPEEIFNQVAEKLREILAELAAKGAKVKVAPELTGKPSQFGSLEELIRLCREVRGLGLCLDFSHLAARTGGEWNSKTRFREALSMVKKELGKEALKSLHIHVSGIEWTEKGESKHTMLKDSRFRWRELMEVLVEMKVSGFVISESPVMEEDAILLKREYERLSGRRKKGGKK